MPGGQPGFSSEPSGVGSGSSSSFVFDLKQDPMFDAIAKAGHARIDHDQPECTEPEPRLADTFGAGRLERDAQAESDQCQADGGEDHPFLLMGHAGDFR